MSFERDRVVDLPEITGLAKQMAKQRVLNLSMLLIVYYI
jgi:hypothetical protein